MGLPAWQLRFLVSVLGRGTGSAPDSQPILGMRVAPSVTGCVHSSDGCSEGPLGAREPIQEQGAASSSQEGAGGFAPDAVSVARLLRICAYRDTSFLKMEARLRMFLALCCFHAASAECPLCASDEICHSDTSSCDCDLAQYTQSVVPLTPTLQCLDNAITLTLSKCQLEKDRYNSEELHLAHSNCTGSPDRTTNQSLIIVTMDSRAGACGNQVKVNDSHVIISNVLNIPARVFSRGIIVRNNVSYSFSCTFPVMMHAALETPLRPITVTKEVSTPEVDGDMGIKMDLFEDNEFGNPYETSDTFPVDETLNATVILHKP